MRVHSLLTLVCIAACAGAARAGQDAPPPASEPSRLSTAELIEDLRILSIVNELQPTREQSTKLAAVAAAGSQGLATIDAEVNARLAHVRERLASARRAAVRGGTAPPETDTQFALARRTAQDLRAAKTETLIRILAGRVRAILTPDQAQRIEDDLAPSNDQPWRRYGRVLTGPGARPGGRMPTDPGWWLKELRDLRIDSAESGPAKEIDDFGKKMTRGIPGGTPLQAQSAGQAQELAKQVLAMPDNVFNQREWQLAKLAAKQQLDTENQQRIQEGKPTESFDPYRWLVEEVMLSPRAAADFRDRAAALGAR